MSRVILPGRWQVPELHGGHRALVEAVLQCGDIPIIGIRKTVKDEKNPYSLQHRIEIFRQAFPEVETFVMPDFDIICHGRKVGYRVISLPKEIEAISGTTMRRILRGW